MALDAIIKIVDLWDGGVTEVLCRKEEAEAKKKIEVENKEVGITSIQVSIVYEKGTIVGKLPKDASYQGVNDKGNPLYFSKMTEQTYESLGGYGTPLYGKPREGNRFRVL